VAGVVLDSSALLAFINGEPGREKVAAMLPDAAMSAVNYAEVISKLVARGGSQSRVIELIKMADIKILEFDEAQAEMVGGLIDKTKSYGLSLGDRACLSLAARDSVRAVTTDKVWEKVGRATGIDVQVIR
jgi:PIN domain nuclease of toxin-antitoxin system